MTMMLLMLGELRFRRRGALLLSARRRALFILYPRRFPAAPRFGRAPRTSRRTSRRRREGLGVRPDDHRRSRGGEAQGQDPHRTRRARRDCGGGEDGGFGADASRRPETREAPLRRAARAQEERVFVLRGGRGGSRRGSRRDRRDAVRDDVRGCDDSVRRVDV